MVMEGDVSSAREGPAFRETQRKQFLGVLTLDRKPTGIKIRNCICKHKLVSQPCKMCSVKYGVANKAGKSLGGGKWKLDGKAP